MSELKVTVEKIKSISPIPGADFLELVGVLGWQCVTRKDAFKIGDSVVYIPIDSVLPEKLEAVIFGPDSKVKLSKHRVKTIKLRGAVSQGLVVSRELLNIVWTTEGFDLTKILGVTKYEAPV